MAQQGQQAAMNFGQFSQANGATGAQAAAINAARARAYARNQ